MKSFPPRIHVLLASEAPIGVVFRRGPSKQVATFLWDRRRDEFSLGQWLKGRIYERRSDISPDGKHLIYFALNGKWHTETLGSWTAISRVPYLKALALFAQGDSYSCGGLWTSKSTYWLDGYTKILKDTRDIQFDRSFEPIRYVGNECLGIYMHRLIRDGWEFVERVEGHRGNKKSQERKYIFSKPTRYGWTLRKITNEGSPRDGKGCYSDEHELIPPRTSSKTKEESALPSIACPEWEWADVDDGRVVWAAHGKLHAAKACKLGMEDEVELQDFNDMHFRAVEAPY